MQHAVFEFFILALTIDSFSIETRDNRIGGLSLE